MAYVILALGAALGYLDYMGQAGSAGTLIYDELFVGSDPYYKWAGALIILWVLGLVPHMEPLAMSMMVLVLLALILSKQSAFTALIKGA